MRKSDLICEFIQGKEKGKASNLYIERYGNHTKLINYETCIAVKIDDYIILNSQYYSVTMSTNQNHIRREADSQGLEIIEIPISAMTMIFVSRVSRMNDGLDSPYFEKVRKQAKVLCLLPKCKTSEDRIRYEEELEKLYLVINKIN